VITYYKERSADTTIETARRQVLHSVAVDAEISLSRHQDTIQNYNSLLFWLSWLLDS
jgi:hypothetical protein